MKKLILLLFFIPLVGIGQDKIDTITSKIKKSVNDSIEKHKSDSIYYNDLWNHKGQIDLANFTKSRAGKIWKHHQDWPKEDCINLANGEYWIGMSPEMATESLGNPETINHSVGSWGVNEQWVYPSLYLYFDNGVLTSYQSSNR